MDDDALIAELRGLKPRRAPVGIETPVLALAEQMSRLRRRERAARRAMRVVALAALLVLGCTLFLLDRVDPAAPSPSAEAALSETARQALDEELDARRLLLAAKLARLKQLAELYEEGPNYLPELVEIERELNALPASESDREGAVEKRSSWIPTTRGESRHA